MHTANFMIENTPGNEARRAIDEEIIVLIAEREAAIRALKSRRNLCSDISRLPPEIIIEICRFAKTGYPQDVKCYQTMNAVASVCRQWRALLLATPDMWNIIDLNARHRALTYSNFRKARLFKFASGVRLSSRPLVQRAEHADELVVKAVGAESARIRELDMRALTTVELMDLIRLYFGMGTPTLESLRLTTVICPPLQTDTLQYDMPSLRRLGLDNIVISSPLPFLPRLSYGKLNVGSTLLLPSLHNTPHLEALDAYVYKGQHTGSRVLLAKPARLTIMSDADELDGAAILASIEHPSNTPSTSAIRNGPEATTPSCISSKSSVGSQSPAHPRPTKRS